MSSLVTWQLIFYPSLTLNSTQHVKGPTHVNGHILDLVFSLGLSIKNVFLEDLHVSDHSCVHFEFNFPRDLPPQKMKAHRRVITQDVAERFSASFDPRLLSGCNDSEVLIQSFNSHCLAILDEVAPVKSNIVSQKKHSPWINESIQSFRRKCRKAEKLWKSTHHEVHRLHLRELRASLNEMLRTARAQYFSKIISSNKNNSKILFDTINSIVSPTTPQVPVFSIADSNDFLHYFVNMISDIRSSIPPSNCPYTVPDLPPLHNWSSFTPVTLQDITALLNKLKPTSCHTDVLPTALFIKVFDVIGPCIMEIINSSLLTSVVPSFFKHAIVEPTLKKPSLDPLQLKNYRPISKLPFISKLLEKVVADQLAVFLEKYEVLDTFQSGFRNKHSTETALLKVTSDILMSADSGEHTVLVLLDLSSAFDTVDHSILINRLHNLVGLSGSVLKWFSSYLSERSFSVSANHIMSDTTGLSCGVPQGSVLGPVLFLLYLLPLGQLICQFEDISYHLYADDIQLYCSFKPTELRKLSSLINCLTSVQQWLSNNYLQLNSDKTETLIIAPDNSIPQIKQCIGALGSSVLPKIRNLGVTFDTAMSLEHHSKLLTKNCFFQLRNISKLRTLVSKAELEMVIHAFISSRLDYCNSHFTCFNKKELDRLQAVQNSAARLLTRTNKRAHITPILASLHWLPVHFRIHFKILVLTFRALQGQAPSYLSDFIQLYIPTRSLRSSDQHLLAIPRTHFKTRGDRSFPSVAPRLWNALPHSLRCLTCVDTFKKHLKIFLFKQAFG